LWDTSVVHTQGIKPVSVQRLQRRNGVYYYRRRVPLPLVAKLGRKVVQVSLHTTSLKEAKKLRTLRDLEWDAKFAACSIPPNGADAPPVQSTALGQPLSETDLVQLVHAYVERQDRAARQRQVRGYPITAEERTTMQIDAEVEAQSLRAQDDLHHQWVYLSGTEALKAASKSFDSPEVPGELFAELVRRGLVELNRRYRARLADDHSRSFFDQLFDPGRPAGMTFGKLAKQHLRLVEEDAPDGPDVTFSKRRIAPGGKEMTSSGLRSTDSTSPFSFSQLQRHLPVMGIKVSLVSWLCIIGPLPGLARQ
jgi:hypothetical protein